jgi:hypothetical protein
LGSVERLLGHHITTLSKPSTFAEIMESLLAEIGSNEPFEIWRDNRSSRVRSLRRALRSLIDKGFVVEIGRGGRRDPFRYFLHPALFETAGKDLSDEARLMLATQAADEMRRAGILLPQ